MTDLEENVWSEKLCQSCGSKVGAEPHIFSFEGIIKKYCSLFCYERGFSLARLSAPVFVAPPSMNIRGQVSRSTTQVEK